MRPHPWCRRLSRMPRHVVASCRHCGLVVDYHDTRHAQVQRLGWADGLSAAEWAAATAGDGGVVTFKGWITGGGWDPWRLEEP